MPLPLPLLLTLPLPLLLTLPLPLSLPLLLTLPLLLLLTLPLPPSLRQGVAGLRCSGGGVASALRSVCFDRVSARRAWRQGATTS